MILKLPASTSISKAHKLLSVVIGVTFPDLRLTSKASPKECAGSVDTNNVRSPASERAIAIAELLLVFPTPPFPPTNTNCVPWEDAFIKEDTPTFDRLVSVLTMCRIRLEVNLDVECGDMDRTQDGVATLLLNAIEKERITFEEMANPMTIFNT